MKALDLYSGIGGAAYGYSRAGIGPIVGVDLRSVSSYPFTFIRGNALAAPIDLQAFDFIHASPPCQHYSAATIVSGNRAKHPDLIGPTRDLLQATGVPWVMENVVGSPLRDPVLICARAFDLRLGPYVLRRHRLFESSLPIKGTGCECTRGDGITMGVYGGGHTAKPRLDGGGGRPAKANKAEAQAIMGIEWGLKREVAEAIPPAYTEFLGRQILEMV
ncbi:MAG TPA: DNA cytosine methyltransferase [Mycobacterium sp.]